jgi:hypothetical protein
MSDLDKALDEIAAWVQWNKHDLGEMGEFIRTKYVYNKLTELRKRYAVQKDPKDISEAVKTIVEFHNNAVNMQIIAETIEKLNNSGVNSGRSEK